MSSLLVLQTKDTVIFASDTALSANIQGKRYRVSNNENKLFDYPDFIMFASGKKYLRDLLVGKLSSTPSLSEIESILYEYIKPISDEFSLEVVIAMKDLSKLVFYSSTNGFEYSESLPNDYINLFTAGYMTDKIADKFEEYYPQLNVYDSLKRIYQEVSCAEIGGSLEIFNLTESKLNTSKIKIDNMYEYQDSELYAFLNLVHANKLVGRMILSNKLLIESTSGVVTIEDNTMTIKDNLNNTKVQLGRYLDPSNSSNYKYGLRINDGAIDIRTTDNANRGMQMDSNGLRAFNNNGVKTFEINALYGDMYYQGTINLSNMTASNITSTTITGGLIQTSSSYNRGIKINSDGLSLYNSSGLRTVYLNANTGDAYFTGNITGSTITGSTINGGNLNIGNGSFVVDSDGYAVMKKASIQTSATNGLYVDINGSSIRGGNLSYGSSYLLGTATTSLGGAYRSGILQLDDYVSNDSSTIDRTMQLTSNTIMVKGSNLVLGGASESNPVVINRRVSTSDHSRYVSSTVALHVVGGISATGSISSNGVPLATKEYVDMAIASALSPPPPPPSSSS